MRTAIPVVFFALAAWFAFGPTASPLPVPPAAAVEAAAIGTAPMRTVRDNPARTDVGGTELSCSECHRLFASKPEASATLMQHTEIRLDHGMNDRCLNCHALEDRDKLVLHGGELVEMTDVAMLCAKCHGPTYRDWQRGTHGRTNGFWDASAGTPQRLVCNQCHDPHAPAFPRLVPLPGPDTLRMGEPAAPSPYPRGPLAPWRDRAGHDAAEEPDHD